MATTTRRPQHGDHNMSTTSCWPHHGDYTMTTTTWQPHHVDHTMYDYHTMSITSCRSHHVDHHTMSITPCRSHHVKHIMSITPCRSPHHVDHIMSITSCQHANCVNANCKHLHMKIYVLQLFGSCGNPKCQYCWRACRFWRYLGAIGMQIAYIYFGNMFFEIILNYGNSKCQNFTKTLITEMSIVNISLGKYMCWS